MASKGPKDSEGDQQFCMEMDLTSNSVQGGADGTVQDTVVPEDSVHPPNAPDNGYGKDTLLRYVENVRNMQTIAGGTGIFDQEQSLDRLKNTPRSLTTYL